MFVFSLLAVDPVNGNLYAARSEGRAVSVVSSTDQGISCSNPVIVSSPPAGITIFPCVTGYNGVVDVLTTARRLLTSGSRGELVR